MFSEGRFVHHASTYHPDLSSRARTARSGCSDFNVAIFGTRNATRPKSKAPTFSLVVIRIHRLSTLNRACHFALSERRDSTTAPSNIVTETGESLGMADPRNSQRYHNTNKHRTVQRVCNNGKMEGFEEGEIYNILKYKKFW